MSYSVSISKNNAQANYVKVSLRAKPLHALFFARTDLKQIQELAELHQPGVYVLIGGPLLYVGEADDLLQRFDNHTKSDHKKWWTHAICFHTILHSPDPLNKAMVKYLEHMLITRFKSAKVSLDNQSVPNEPFLSEVDKSLMDEEFLPSILEVLDIFNIFKPAYYKVTQENQVHSEDTKPVATLDIQNKAISQGTSEQVFPLVDKWMDPKSRKDENPVLVSKTEKIKSKHYCEVKIDGRWMTAKNWSEMYLEVFKYLVSVHGEELIYKQMSNRLSLTPFSKGDAVLTMHSWLDSSNRKWYLLTEIGTDEKKSSIKRVAQICHCDLILK